VPRIGEEEVAVVTTRVGGVVNAEAGRVVKMEASGVVVDGAEEVIVTAAAGRSVGLLFASGLSWVISESALILFFVSPTNSDNTVNFGSGSVVVTTEEVVAEGEKELVRGSAGLGVVNGEVVGADVSCSVYPVLAENSSAT
jgi:hypothetical protein